MNNPLISIIIPTYNRENLIGETLNSVLAQTYQNWECIIVDDRSIDATVEVLEKFAKKDKRIKIFERPINLKKGASSCRNFGLTKIKGGFVQYLDSDDVLHESKFQKQMEKINTTTICTCKWGYFSGSDYFSRLKNKQNCYRNFNKPYRLLYYFGKYNEFLPLHNYLIPLDIIKKAGNWNIDLSNNDDAEYMTRILIFADKINFISDTYVFYRVEGESTLSGFQSKEKAVSAVKSVEIITENIKALHPRTSRSYTNTLKKNLLQKIKSNYPEIIAENKHLFNL